MTLLILVLLLSIFSFFIPLNINVKFTKKNNNENLEIKFITLRGLIKIGIEIPFAKTLKKHNDYFFHIEPKLEGGKNEKNILSLNQMVTLKKIYLKTIKNREIFLEVKNYLLKKISIKKLYWNSKIGLEDAAITGIAIGLLWNFKNILIIFINNNIQSENISYNIIPEFNKKVFETKFDCIIRVKLVYIIIAGFIGLKSKVKRVVK
ncbi:DUF2953 domain-containing protein [Thermohalobacter berrensis]|uniref:DUF2953 domain-containing protein n=1 Tax=Thermohalobacter berrensis TaxID=99594 RepID=A0A419TAR3_9FIRM|nr:DUF2953 domain-containing protein [Thermohalobacter berrensis]RKD34542.1 hypothetical protein BET03_01560 [Thermohalobacter berrensis]